METNAKNGSFSVLIPDGDTANTLSVVRCLGEIKNVKIFILSKAKNKPVRYSRYITKFIYYSCGDTKEEKLTAIKDAIEKTNADVLLPIDVEFIRLVAEYKGLLSKLIAIAPMPDVKSFDIANDKWLLSLWLEENNILHPQTILLKAKDSLDQVLSSLTFPIIVKPRNGFGGNGIKIFQHAEELPIWYNGSNHQHDFICQPYIKGYDIDFSVICNEGEILVHAIQKNLKYLTNDQWAYAVEFAENDELYSLVREMAEKFNWSGVNHIDLRYDEDKCQFTVIEMNPRFWASVLATIFTGVNFPYTSCLLALQKEVPKIQPTHKIVINTADAAKMMMKRFTNREYLHFDNTYFELTIKDPLPTLIKEIL